MFDGLFLGIRAFSENFIFATCDRWESQFWQRMEELRSNAGQRVDRSFERSLNARGGPQDTGTSMPMLSFVPVQTPPVIDVAVVYLE